MDWFCLTEEQILKAPQIQISNPEVLCNIKLDVVLNIRRSVNKNYDHDIKDEISKTCKDFKTKKLFEDYLSQIDEQNESEGDQSNEQAAKKLESFDNLMEKGLASTSVQRVVRAGGSQSVVNGLDKPDIVRVLS